MIPTQQHPGWVWQSNDLADIWLNDHGDEQPKSITCTTPEGGNAAVNLEQMQFLGAGLFGEARGGNVKWTGEAYRYGVYLTRNEFSSPTITILESSGAGMRGLVLKSNTCVETWKHLASTLSPEMLWNICHETMVLLREAINGERRRIYAAFAEGRLKKARRDRRVHVTEEPAA